MRKLNSTILVLTGATLAFVLGGCATVPYRQQVVEYEPVYCDDVYPPPPRVVYVEHPIIVVKQGPARHVEHQPTVTLHPREEEAREARTPSREVPRQPVITRPEPERLRPQRVESSGSEERQPEPQRTERQKGHATVVDRNDDRAVAAERVWAR